MAGYGRERVRIYAVERRAVAAHLHARLAPDTGLVVARRQQAPAGRAGMLGMRARLTPRCSNPRI
jgi:hypothetical protein